MKLGFFGVNGDFPHLPGSTVGWSDLYFCAIFKIEHIAADQVYFYEFNSKKSAKFSYLKDHRDLKNK